MPESVKREVERLVTLVSETTEAYTAALFIVDDDDPSTLTLFAHHTLSTQFDESVHISLGHGLVGWVAKNDRATHAQNFGADSQAALRYYTGPEEIKSFMAAPVRHNDRVIAVLAVDSKRQYVFTDKAIKLLESFSGAIGEALVRGRKLVRYGQEAVTIDALSRLVDRVSSAESVGALCRDLKVMTREIVPHDSLAIAIRSLESDTFLLIHTRGADSKTPHPLSKNRLGMVIQGGAAIFAPEIGSANIYPGCDKEARSFLGVPLIAGAQAIGALGFLSKEPRAFSKSHERALNLLAASCASAFVSLRAHNRDRAAEYFDPVTGLHNHRYLSNRTEPLIGKGGVISINLIGFSHVNREVGIAGGDAILSETAHRLSAVMEERGTLVRYYGDRFILLLEDEEEKEVAAVADELSRAIEEEAYHYDGAQIHIKPALGVTFYPLHGEGLEGLVMRAGEAAGVATVTPGLRVSLYGESAALLRSIR